MPGIGGKIISGDHGHMIGIGASLVIEAAEKVDAINMRDEFTQTERPLTQIGFHSLK